VDQTLTTLRATDRAIFTALAIIDGLAWWRGRSTTASGPKP
jgi:hypothetical protein